MAAVCLEFGVGAHVDDATLAWVYDPRWWGLCGQGVDEASALDDLTVRAHRSYVRFLERHGEGARPLRGVEVAERIHGDELTFQRDHEPATNEELQRTVARLVHARQELLTLIEDCSEAELDGDDPDRHLPRWAGWRTLRQMAFHIADTESRSYLAALDVAPPERCEDLSEELRRSQGHVLAVLAHLERDRAVTSADGCWTTRKVLRRLAWHEARNSMPSGCCATGHDARPPADHRSARRGWRVDRRALRCVVSSRLPGRRRDGRCQRRRRQTRAAR